MTVGSYKPIPLIFVFKINKGGFDAGAEDQILIVLLVANVFIGRSSAGGTRAEK
jgi:hypothetical protein